MKYGTGGECQIHFLHSFEDDRMQSLSYSVWMFYQDEDVLKRHYHPDSKLQIKITAGKIRECHMLLSFCAAVLSWLLI